MAANWKWSRRIKVIEDTYRFIFNHNGPLLKAMLKQEGFNLVKVRLECEQELRIQLRYDDQFRKEGEIGIFIEISGICRPIASLAFSLEQSGEWRCLIGSVQGARGGGEKLVKAATKLLFGIRPKILIVYIAQEIARNLGIHKILGVSNQAQIYRCNSKILKKKNRLVVFDYDALWLELGSEPICDEWYRIPLEMPRRSREDMKPNKRSMYTKRYALLDQISSQIRAAMQ